MKIFWKRIVFAEFRANCKNLCGICAFPQISTQGNKEKLRYFRQLLFHGSTKNDFPAEAVIWNHSQIAFRNTLDWVHFTVKFNWLMSFRLMWFSVSTKLESLGVCVTMFGNHSLFPHVSYYLNNDSTTKCKMFR